MDQIELESKFFEEYPLYREFTISFDPKIVDVIHLPPLVMFCEKCSEIKTFRCSDIAYMGKPKETISIRPNQIKVCTFYCTHCLDCNRYFIIRCSPNNVEKIGQYPSWDINIDRDFLKLLGEYRKNYKKGIICESQGYGIGAYAYYRRIVEEIIDKLLNSISDLLDEDEKKNYEAALEKTKKEIIAAKKIELVKDLLPASLRPGNINPLDILYQALSKGIHNETDEECLELAEQIRKILLNLVINISKQKEYRREITESMRKVLNKTKK